MVVMILGDKFLYLSYFLDIYCSYLLWITPVGINVFSSFHASPGKVLATLWRWLEEKRHPYREHLTLFPG